MKNRRTSIFSIAFLFKISLFFVLYTASMQSFAQPFGVEWVQQIGNENRDIINDMALDKAGNVYAIGSFSGVFKVNGQTSIIANGAQDAFVSKTSKDGKLLWAKQIGSKGQDFACRMAVSPNGKLYVIGAFDELADAGKQKSINTDHGLYVSQFSASGDVKWVKYFASSQMNHYSGMTTDADNNVYVMGCFYDSLSIDNNKWFAKPSGSIFVAKLSSDGALQAFKQFEGQGEKYPSVIQVSGNGLWIGGHYTLNLQADSLKLSTIQQDKKGIFAITLDKSLNVENGWTISEGNQVSLSAMVVDSTGIAYLGGNFVDSISTQGTILKGLGKQDVYITAIDTAGHCLWSKRAGGVRSNNLTGMAQNLQNEILITFSSNSSAIYDGLPAIEHKCFDDVQLAAIDSTGRFLWSTAYGGFNEDFPCRIAVDKENKMILSAMFKDSIAIGDNVLQSSGSKDIFIAKLVDCAKQHSHLYGDTLLCIGSQGTLSATDPSYTSYVWEYGAGSDQSFSINKAGIYHFSGMDRYGCQLFDSIKVRSLPLPVFSLGKDTTIYSIQSINIQANQTLSAYQWQDGSFSSSYLFNGSNDNIGQNLVWLKGTDKNGCSNTDSLLVTVKQVVFSNAQQLDSANISIFPNPAHGLVNYSIDISLQNILVRVVDNFGHVYLEKQVGDYIQNIPDQMNVSMLNEGMYYIKVYSSSAVKSQVFYVR